MKFKSIILICTLSVPGLAHSNTQISAGTGYQHGSLLGAQIAFQSDANRYYVAAGLVGVAVGYERVIDSSEQHSLGFAVGKEELTSEDGFAVATYNYYFNGIAQPGWKLGFSLGARREDTASFFGDSGDSTTKTAISLDLAYKF